MANTEEEEEEEAEETEHTEPPAQRQVCDVYDAETSATCGESQGPSAGEINIPEETGKYKTRKQRKKQQRLCFLRKWRYLFSNLTINKDAISFAAVGRTPV